MEGPLYEQIYNYVFNQIHNKILRPGDRVPSEKELSEQFKVSRITSKKALEMLANAGVVERVRGKGSFVSHRQPAQLPQLAGHAKDAVSPQDKPLEEKLIGVILPDIGESYGLKLFRAIEERCSELGFGLIVRLTNDEREEEQKAIRFLTKLGVDGLIVFPVHGEHYNEELVRLVLDGFPIVLIDRYLKGIAACSVCTDNKKASFELTSFLLEQGHEHVAFISTPPENTTTIEERIQGFQNALAAHGQTFKAELLLTDFSSTLPRSLTRENMAADQKLIRHFAERHAEVTGFVACEYNLAVILDQELRSVHASASNDKPFEIVCFDSPDSVMAKPPFIHVKQNEEEMGIQAVDLLVDQWSGIQPPLLNMVEYIFAT